MTRYPDPDDDPAVTGVEDELQDLVGRVRDRRDDGEDAEELDFSLDGKLPPDHPEADLLDDLDL